VRPLVVVVVVVVVCEEWCSQSSSVVLCLCARVFDARDGCLFQFTYAIDDADCLLSLWDRGGLRELVEAGTKPATAAAAATQQKAATARAATARYEDGGS
jgi:hypothetical protein